jgi:hypothetical protein
MDLVYIVLILTTLNLTLDVAEKLIKRIQSLKEKVE